MSVAARFPASLETTCRPCGGRIVWAFTDVNGRRIPLDPEPDAAGNQAAMRDALGAVRTRQLGAGDEPEPWERRMMPHFPECKRRQAERAAGRAARALPAGVVDLAAERRRRQGRAPIRTRG